MYNWDDQSSMEYQSHGQFINITGILAGIEFNCRFLEMDLIKPEFVAVFSVLATCQEDLLRACKKGSQN